MVGALFVLNVCFCLDIQWILLRACMRQNQRKPECTFNTQVNQKKIIYLMKSTLTLILSIIMRLVSNYIGDIARLLLIIGRWLLYLLRIRSAHLGPENMGSSNNPPYYYKGIWVNYVGKADLSKDYWNPKIKLGITTHFWEIIKLQFWKIRYIILYFNAR